MLRRLRCGILVNWGSYDLDFLLGIAGWSLRPRRVLGSIHTPPAPFDARLPPGSDAESHAIGLVTFDGGVTLAYERAELYPAPMEESWEIIGTRGSLKLAMGSPTGPPLVQRTGREDGGITETLVWQGPDDWNAIQNGPAHDFVAAIREGRAPRTSLEQALVVADITDGICRSAERGGSLDLP